MTAHSLARRGSGRGPRVTAFMGRNDEGIENPGLNVFARFQAKPGMEGRVERALVEMIDPTIQEEANIGYALHRSADDPRMFLLYEQWRDKAALDNHMSQPYFAKMEEDLRDALLVPMEVITATMIAGETSPAAMRGTTS